MSDTLPNVYAVIMAGGSGTRFWPLSRETYPKQVLPITGSKSLIRNTVDRINGLIDLKKQLIVTNQQQERIIKSQIPELPAENFIIEPKPRNTAACIGLAALHIKRLDPKGIMVVLPSDHLITSVNVFQRTIRTGVELAVKSNPLVTIGIPPTRAETGYGYIQFETSNDGLPDDVFKVKAFAEKPNKATAERFISVGDFYWNSGMFIWSVERILHEIEEYLPELFEQLGYIDKAFKKSDYNKLVSEYYNRIKSISIDYGIMEKTKTPVYMLKGNFTWSDVGSWDELYRLLSKGLGGNVSEGEVVTLSADNNLLFSPDKMTAVIGLDNILVVNTEDATLICPLDRAQDVKLIVEKLKKEGRKDYL